ncbi:MAG: hypothetical protein ABI183_02015 [Polyangiaceae bacterium]
MRRRIFGFSVLAATTSALVFAYGCGGDDTTGGGDTSDASPGNDATTSDANVADTSTPKDAATTTDASVDAGSSHIAFVTATSFNGDLIGAANAADAGTVSLDGGAFTDYISATNALCTADAKRAGRTGKFVALVQAGADDMFARISDSDGPWALPDGTPVAETAAQFKVGDMHAGIDENAGGTRVTYKQPVWSLGYTGSDCTGWTSSAASVIHGNAGQAGIVSQYAFNNLGDLCVTESPLYCVEVGSGGAPNKYPTIPAGGKIAFVAAGPYPGNFALSDAGVLDAAAPPGDQVHGVGDAICNELAAGAGRSGDFHAWVSSSTTGAAAYFTGLSMNGPWYQLDGLEVAASLSVLTTTGPSTQISLDATGHFPTLSFVKTGTAMNGTLNVNCNDFASKDSAEFTTSGFSAFKLTGWTDSNTFPCSSPSALYCFEK